MGFTQVQSGDAVRLSHCGDGPGQIPGHTAAADLNGDSNIDLYVSCEAGVESQVLLGDGDGGFTAQTGPAANGPTVTSAKVMHTSIGHLNGDSNLDLFVCVYEESDVKSQIYYGGGDGTFTTEADDSWQRPYSGGCASCLADLTGDGNLDIYVAPHKGPNELYAGDGAGGFARSYTADGGVRTRQTDFNTDADGDGVPDFQKRADDTRNDNPITAEITSGATMQAICEDLDGDQHLDVYLTRDEPSGLQDSSFSNMLFHGDGAGNFVRDTTSPAALGGGNSRHTAAADLNGGESTSFFQK
jgi:hypothetical protein